MLLCDRLPLQLLLLQSLLLLLLLWVCVLSCYFFPVESEDCVGAHWYFAQVSSREEVDHVCCILSRCLPAFPGGFQLCRCLVSSVFFFSSKRCIQLTHLVLWCSSERIVPFKVGELAQLVQFVSVSKVGVEFQSPSDNLSNLFPCFAGASCCQFLQERLRKFAQLALIFSRHLLPH